MYETVSKLVFIITTTWIMVLISIICHFKYSPPVKQVNDNNTNQALSTITITEEVHLINENKKMSAMETYEKNLQKYMESGRKYRYEVWNTVSSRGLGFPLEEKYSAIQGRKYPPGMNGEPVFLRNNILNPIRAMIQQGYRDHAFNEFVSELIPVNRTLPDVRDDWCKSQNYSSNLPQASVVITFHNEAWSTLLRTIYSVLNRTPNHLLKEIILIDDASTMHHLDRRLEKRINKLPKVKLVRKKARQGVVRARIRAMDNVTAPVVVFLDSHVECTRGWLEPLLDRIAKDATRVVSPVVDRIHEKTFEYIPQETYDLRIGGFNWDMDFVWQTIPSRVLAIRKQLAAPIKTPTISGGLFAIDKEYFKKLGYFDEEFAYWGAENMELSFKTWMCGGSLEIIPCSHVGHVFRTKFPYFRNPSSVRRNYMRLAKVWLDDYSKYFYERHGYFKQYEYDIGNVTDRQLLRNRLNCKSFEWYLKEVYPEQQIPDNYVASGMISGLSGDERCFDSSTSAVEAFIQNVNLLPCHFMGGNQFWVYTADGEIKRDNLCLDDRGDNESLNMNMCHGRKSQMWVYINNTKMIQNVGSHLCIGGVTSPAQGFMIIVQRCDTGRHRQTWQMQNYIPERLSPAMQVYVKKLSSLFDVNQIGIQPSISSSIILYSKENTK